MSKLKLYRWLVSYPKGLTVLVEIVPRYVGDKALWEKSLLL